MSQHEIVILGGGPAGLTAALYTARSGFNPVLLSGPLPGGQLMTTTEVENFPGFEQGILGPDLMEAMNKQAARFGTQYRPELATKIEEAGGELTVHLEGGDKLTAKSVIIATGAKARTLSLENEAKFMGFGLSTCATCDGAFFRDEEIVVVGGGDSACEEALYLTRFGKRVRLIHRRDELRASKIMADRVIEHEKVEVLWNKNVVELLGEPGKALTGARLEDSQTGESSEIDCAALFYAIGHIPNTPIFEGFLEMDEQGYLLTKPDSTQTDVKGVFACGDVQDHVFRQAITAAGSGCMAALEAERYLQEL